MSEVHIKFGRDIDATDLLPAVSRDSLDIQEIMRIHNTELNLLWKVMLDILSDQFIRYATDYGLSQWEYMLDISPQDMDDLESRRNEILSVLIGVRPFTLERVQEILDFKFGKNVINHSVVHDKYEYWLDIANGFETQINNILDYVDDIIPKNLLILFRSITVNMMTSFIGAIADSADVIHIEADLDVNKLQSNVQPYVGSVIDIAYEVINI